MKILFVIAHPNKESLSHTILHHLQNTSLKSGHTTEILDLYDTPYKQDYFAFQDNPNTKIIQEKITQANHLIFIFPIWWWDAPAIFKNFYDSTFLTGFWFKYVNGKAVGLLQWKTVDIITTSWGPSWLYNIVLPIKFLWNLNRIAFCGMKLRVFKVIGNADTKKFQFDNVRKFLENFKI